MSSGGWTIVQRRFVGDVSFNQSYTEYIQGFGGVRGDYWLGLEKMHVLSTLPGSTSSLRIDVQQYSGTRGYQLYHNVSVDNANSGYVLHVTQTAQDSKRNGPPYTDSLHYNNGRQFSAYDHDVLGWHCSTTRVGAGAGGGWWFWFRGCAYVNLNAVYGRQSGNGITIHAGLAGSFFTNPMMGFRRN
jgi:ficolin